ncbi:MAG TPA: cysteine hydrolase family protein [Anaerolineales bacterium]
MKTVLLVIDIQNDYFPGGKFPLVNPEEASKNAYQLLQCFREHGGHHVHIQHISLKPDAAFFIKGDSGSDIHDSVAHFEGEPIVYKHYPNSFRETDLLDVLKEWEIERAVICGMMTHMCVDATVRAAADLGFQVLLAEDACTTRDLTYGDTLISADLVHKSFLAALKSYGKVMKTEEILALLAAEMVK